MKRSPLYALLLAVFAGTAFAQANSPAPDPATRKETAPTTTPAKMITSGL